jgi:APA family basic amino acid/polyamine antiporter
MSNPLFGVKSITQLRAEAEGHAGLKRTLGPFDLVGLGIGAIIGAGLFVRTAAAAANNAGPSVTIGFIVAAVGSAFAGLCYAEFASMIPIAGSAYTYAYATMGELAAWIIGWDLILEYAIGAATVGIAWSEYLNKLLGRFGLHIPYAWCHSPLEVLKQPQTVIENGVAVVKDVVVAHGIINVPAVFIVLMLTLLLIRGIRESAFINGLIVITKVAIVLLFIAIGWQFINPANHIPYIPPPGTYVDSQDVSHHYGGLWGILGAGGVVFFAFIGFDAVSTAAQEAKKPKRDMPIGILGSLAICTVLYILFAHVLTGVASVQDFRTHGREASVVFAIEHYMHGYQWLATFVTVAILAGFSSVILVMLLGQSRVFFAMSRDGLVPSVFSATHPRFGTPHKSNLIFFLLVGAFSGLLPEDIVGDMTSIGTLFAFILVCAGVIILRVKQPELQRDFRTPLVPLFPILGIIVCGAMIAGLGWTNWLRLGVWLVIGLFIYGFYGRKHSKLRAAAAAPPPAS